MLYLKPGLTLAESFKSFSLFVCGCICLWHRHITDGCNNHFTHWFGDLELNLFDLQSIIFKKQRVLKERGSVEETKDTTRP